MYDVFMYVCFFCFAGRFSILFGSGHRTILTLYELLAVRFEDHLRALTSVSSHESVYDASLFVRAIVMSGACIVGLYHAVPCCTVLVPCCTMLYRVVPCLHHVVTCCTVRVPGCTMLYHVVPCLYHPCTMLYRAVARSSLCFECACKKPDRPACCSIASSTAPREARSCCDCPTENRCK